MRPIGVVAACTAALVLTSPGLAWNATGHRIVATIAYERLTPQVRARVDELIKEHPDYALFIRNAPQEPRARARAAFIHAATWPDDIKGDPRFWTDTNKDARPTPVLPGFSDMKRHTNWHYFNTPFAPDGAQAPRAEPPNALTELRRMIREIGQAPEATQIYDLPWIEHITGDLHQPLHCISRFLEAQPEGDAGGNRVFIAAEAGNLHALWDDAAGTEQSGAYVTRYAAKAMAMHPPPQHISKDPKQWIAEGAQVAETQVYSFGLETGSREHPIHLPAGYLQNARSVAQERIAVAGYRLAAMLNSRLK